jgi:polar amino acid transport system substrate-binding protein
MKLDQRAIETVPDLFEEDILAMLAAGEIDAAAVTPTSAGYYNFTHPRRKVRFIPAFSDEPELSWNVAVGMRRPDAALQRAVDDALARMLADGTIKRIYARYGVELQPPQ